jgi:hypothetical protein
MKVVKGLSQVLLGSVALMLGSAAHAQAVSYTGTIEIIEIWKIGNVAFRLNGFSSACAFNNWMVLNKSSDGTRNMYAALLAAKMSGKAVRISSPGCAPAENYNSTPYLQIDYLFIAD